MSIPADSDAVFRYNYLPNGIHELILLTPTKEALDQCFARLDVMFAQAALDRPLLLVSDVRSSGIPPLGLLVSFTRRLFHHYPKHPLIYDAILLHQEGRFLSGFMAVVQRLASLYNARIRFFRGDEYQKAVNWLLESRDADGNPAGGRT